MKTANLKKFYVCMLALVLSLLFLKTPDVIYASDGGEEETKAELNINGVDFSNIFSEDFDVNQLTPEQWQVISEILSMMDWEDVSVSDDWSAFGGLGSTPEPETTGEEPTRGYSQGVGSTGNAIITTNDLNGSLEFVPFTTKEGQQFYLLIDYSQSDNNVYFLDAVTMNDLVHIAETETDADGNPIYLELPTKEVEKEEVTEESSEEVTEAEEPEEEEKKKSNSMSDSLVMLFGIVIIAAIAFVVIYFVKVKGKKIDEDEDDFGLDDEESDEDEEIFPEESAEDDAFSMEMKDEPEEMFDIDDVEVNEETPEFIEDDDTDNSDF